MVCSLGQVESFGAIGRIIQPFSASTLQPRDQVPSGSTKPTRCRRAPPSAHSESSTIAWESIEPSTKVLTAEPKPPINYFPDGLCDRTNWHG